MSMFSLFASSKTGLYPASLSHVLAGRVCPCRMRRGFAFAIATVRRRTHPHTLVFNVGSHRLCLFQFAEWDTISRPTIFSVIRGLMYSIMRSA